MTYAYSGEGSLDYYPCQYGASKLVFRGPKKGFARPYIAAIGGTETYGKFVQNPFAKVLEEIGGRGVVNLGLMNAGPDVFLNAPEVLEIASGAVLTVVQVVGAQNLSNRYYTVHPRRNDRFLRASPELQNLYPEVDFSEFHFTRHMLQSLFQASPHRFVKVAAALQATWAQRMAQLLRAVKSPTLLLWMGDSPPKQAAVAVSPYDATVLVNAGMIEALRSQVTAYLEVVLSHDAIAEGVGNMSFGPMERICAANVPGPIAHREVAIAIANALPRLTSA
ncbi:DUF6473 family protein [Pseudorhodobacter sp. W20_MBD10_FR17]|uniref:DUF6473 family protein n=1 Tax=Pseudorhodobacter sp. W20_MBD10_FR17 TaxID=3240266 RepID=UPI003F9DAF7E